jgi:hypothetical protein
MQKEYEELMEIYDMHFTTDWAGHTHTNIMRRDNKRVVSLYDVFLDTLQILQNNNKLK